MNLKNGWKINQMIYHIGCDKMDIYIVIALLCVLDGVIGLAIAVRNNEKWGILVFLLSIFILIMLFVAWLLENKLILLGV